jgi:hypothetical protein
MARQAAQHVSVLLLAAAILLLPAMIWGRPFVFYDTPAYWGWGRDVVEALARPWPHAGQAWIPGRPMYGWETGSHGASPEDLRFTLTLLSARSSFYAVPTYLLSALGGLWLIAAVQALAVAGALRVAVRAMIPTAPDGTYLGCVVALTALTALGFEAAYVMPDVFGGLAILAAVLLIARPERIDARGRVALCGLILYGVLAHMANGLVIAAIIVVGLAVFGGEGVRKAAARVAPVAGVLALGLVVAAGGQAILTHAFGRAPVMAPFAASRVLADGAGQRFLKQACAHEQLAACDLASVTADYPEYYLGLYPLEAPPSLLRPGAIYNALQYRQVSAAEAEQREAFVAEQPRIVTGAILADGPRLAARRLADGARELFAVAIGPDFDSLAGLLREQTQRRAQMVAITPGAGACGLGAQAACGALDATLVGALQEIVFWASLLATVIGLLRKPRDVAGNLRPVFALILFGVLANAFICGGVSGVYDRYQIRVAWLIPLCAAAWLAQAITALRAARATLPSSAAPIISSAPAQR